MHHIADARIELDDTLSSLAATTSVRARATWLGWAGISAAVVGALGIGALGTYLYNTRANHAPGGGRADTPTVTERQITTNPIEDPVVFAAISPDGKYVAYNDSTAIRIRLIDTGETRTLSVPPNFCFR